MFKQGLAGHQLKDTGLLEVNPEGRHPIFDLISRAEKAWDEKLSRQSRTLAEAVREYRRRYQREPPIGFDNWWNYVTKHNVQLPDEYDQIYRDLEPFWGMSSAHLKLLQGKYESEKPTYTISNGKSGFKQIRMESFALGSDDETDVLEGRFIQQLEMLEPVAQWLPPFRATFTYHDNPMILARHELRARAVGAAAVKEYMESWDTTDEHLGWGEMCPPWSPLRRLMKAKGSADLDIGDYTPLQTKSFIYDHLKSMDPCVHYSHLKLNGQLLNFVGGPEIRQYYHPRFSMSTTRLHADILVPSPENWVGDIGNDPPWHEKPYDTLVWRGSTTGMRHVSATPWYLSQRLRMVELANNQIGKYSVLPLRNANESVGAPIEVPADELNKRLMDIAFTGSPIQCEPEICSKMGQRYKFLKQQLDWTAANKYKYMLDGNGWSARFKRLMTTNSLILKATICPEWFSERVMPWVHYVPVKIDLTDLYDIMLFFRGDGAGNPGYDDLASKIAAAGKQWSKTFWRKEDQTAYMFRLMLEWARLLSPDRDSMTFILTEENEDS
ncbi:hypothetical protein CPB86DRAFT_718049 [Serendipita vermifera]|nr:hypothetical protein CPB86DRAFT_718049 [Serendipita vermifera]